MELLAFQMTVSLFSLFSLPDAEQIIENSLFIMFTYL